VAVLRSLNQTNDEIAHAMGISERTLRTKYLPELKAGLAQKRAAARIKLYELGMAGNVAALKAFLKMADDSDLKVPSSPRASRPPVLGKKEQQLIDAATPDATSSIGELLAQRAQQGIH
jgi:hypothetical protein